MGSEEIMLVEKIRLRTRDSRGTDKGLYSARQDEAEHLWRDERKSTDRGGYHRHGGTRKYFRNAGKS